MATVVEIPTEAEHPFTETITWGGVAYALAFKWNSVNQCWGLDIFAEDGVTPILTGLALITGTDILGQFGYLPVGATTVMTVMSIGPFVSPDSVPNFYSLGSDGHVYLVMP
jgi:hypothetical protein